MHRRRRRRLWSRSSTKQHLLTARPRSPRHLASRSRTPQPDPGTMKTTSCQDGTTARSSQPQPERNARSTRLNSLKHHAATKSASAGINKRSPRTFVSHLLDDRRLFLVDLRVMYLLSHPSILIDLYHYCRYPLQPPHRLRKFHHSRRPLRREGAVGPVSNCTAS